MFLAVVPELYKANPGAASEWKFLFRYYKYQVEEPGHTSRDRTFV